MIELVDKWARKKESQRRWRLNHPEKVKEAKRKYNDKHREQINAYYREYWAKKKLLKEKD